MVPLTADGRLSAKEFIGGPQRLSKMQTDFHQHGGDKFGLSRGVVGSRARHQEVRRFYAGLNAPLKLPKVGSLDHLGAALGIKTSAMKGRLHAEAVLRHRGSAAGVKTLGDLRSDQAMALQAAVAERVKSEEQSVPYRQKRSFVRAALGLALAANCGSKKSVKNFVSEIEGCLPGCAKGQADLSAGPCSDRESYVAKTSGCAVRGNRA